MQSYRVAELKSKARKSGSGREFGATDASTSGGMGFYVHDVQPTVRTGLSETIINSPMAKGLEPRGLLNGANSAVIISNLKSFPCMLSIALRKYITSLFYPIDKCLSRVFVRIGIPRPSNI